MTAGLLALVALLPSGAALGAVSTRGACYFSEGSLGDGQGWSNHAERACVLDETKTGGQGVLCSSDEWQRGGGFGKEFPAAYRGEQTCAASVEGNSVCVGYAWHYANEGGEVEGDKDGYECNGLV